MTTPPNSSGDEAARGTAASGGTGNGGNGPSGRTPAGQPAGSGPNPIRRLSPIRPRSRGRISVDERREDVREFLARRLVSVLILTLVIGSALMASRKFTGVSAEDTRLFFQVAFTAIISLVSAATGFYFGASANRGGIPPDDDPPAPRPDDAPPAPGSDDDPPAPGHDDSSESFLLPPRIPAETSDDSARDSADRGERDR